MEIEFQTDIGRKRSTNQDCTNAFVNQRGVYLAILADGMGGHRAGDVASQMAVNDLGAAWEQTEFDHDEGVPQWLIQELQKVNERIYEVGMSSPEMQGMGTTVVAAAIFDGLFTLANIGDSRAYLIRNGDYRQLTEDHSLVNELVKSGQITPEMAEVHPRKNILTRSVGMAGHIEVDVSTHDYQAGDNLLLCSDGLTNMVSDEEIAEVIAQDLPLSVKLEELIARANEAGGADNITVLVASLEEDCR